MAAPCSTKTVYDEQFFAYTSSLSNKSAEVIVPILRKLLPGVASVVDFGCAQGVWLKHWMDNGIDDIQGVDGDYIDLSKLAIPGKNFYAQDLNEPIDLGRHFDLAYSLEVAEHLHPENSERFIESLTCHADIVLFSAAPPGQGGESHINERSFDSWRALFYARRYAAYDCVCPSIANLNEVSFWYRYNVMLYVHNDFEATLPKNIRATKVDDGQPIADISPPLFKLRKFIIRLLPYGLQNLLARGKAVVQD